MLDEDEEISPDDALDVVEPLFADMLEVFHASGLPLVVTLHCAPWVHDSPRHFAACRRDGKAVVVAPRIVTLDADMVRAILAHELGHAADFTWPARFMLRGDRLALDRPMSELAYQQALRRWKERTPHEVELTADAIAERVTGHEIGYCGPCLLQCFDKGRARPAWLR